MYYAGTILVIFLQVTLYLYTLLVSLLITLLSCLVFVCHHRLAQNVLSPQRAHLHGPRGQ